MSALLKEQTITAEILRQRLDYTLARVQFIEHCVENTRALCNETDDESALLFFAMLTLGRFTAGSTAVQDFTRLFRELDRQELADIVESSSYRAEDLAFFWSTTKDISNLFCPSPVETTEEYQSSELPRPVHDTIMKNEWRDYAFYEIDKVSSSLNPRKWALYNLDNATIAYDTAQFVVLDDAHRPVMDLCSKNYQHVYFTDMFREHMNSRQDAPASNHQAAQLDEALMIQDLIRQPNFCHWLLDQIPRLRHLEDSQKVIMYKLAPFMANMLELMGIDPERVHLLGERSVVKIRQLAIESSMAKNFYHPCQDINADLIEFVKASFHAPHTAAAPTIKHRNIYLSRNKFERRRVSNEAGLLEVLAQYDFHTVHPEELSMPEQIELFRNAKVIVSPHGAGLANLIFCEDTTLVEIFNQNYGTPTFYIICTLLGFPYQHIIANNPMLTEDEQKDVRPGQMQCEDMEVDLKKLEECLSTIFA